MDMKRHHVRALLFMAILVCPWLAVVALVAGGASPAPMPASTQTPVATGAAAASPAQASGFVGDDTCTACHESQGTSLHASLHGKTQIARTPATPEHVRFQRRVGLTVPRSPGGFIAGQHGIAEQPFAVRAFAAWHHPSRSGTGPTTLYCPLRRKSFD